MKRTRETGFATVMFKGGTCDRIHHGDFVRVRSEWQAGQAFSDCRDPYGDPISVKLGEVVAVSLNTPGGLADYRADQAANAADDAISGA